MEIEISQNENKRRFWNYSKSLGGMTDNNTPNLHSKDSGYLAGDSKDKADVRNSYSTSVFTGDDGLLPDLSTRSAHWALETFDFDVINVYELLT